MSLRSVSLSVGSAHFVFVRVPGGILSVAREYSSSGMAVSQVLVPCDDADAHRFMTDAEEEYARSRR